MGWLDLARATFAAAGIVFIPGVVVTLLMGLRGFAAWAVAAPAGVTVIALAAIGAPIAGVIWGLIPALVVTVALALVGAALRLLLWRSRKVTIDSSRMSIWSLLAIVGATLIAVVQVLVVIGSPENFSQTFDNVFHLNAVRFALDTGSISPLTIGAMTSPDSGGLPFYPSGWHAIASLVVASTGVSIPVASNAVMIVFGALVWPTSAVFLARAIFGTATPVLVSAAAVSVALPAFPLLLISYGVLFPLMMAFALAPVTVALVIASVRGTRDTPIVPFVLVTLGTLPGIGVAHPGGIASVMMFSAVALTVAWIFFLRSDAGVSRKWIASAGMGGVFLVGSVIWINLRPPREARGWGTTQTVGQAIGEVVSVSLYAGPISVMVAALVLMGVLVAARRRSLADWTGLALLATGAALYIICSAVPYFGLRDLFTGPWYNNTPRVAALLPLAWVPIAAIGGAHLWALLVKWTMRIRPPRVRTAVLALAAVLGLVVIPQATSVRVAVSDARSAFAITEDADLVDSDELVLLDRLDAEVPPDAVILGNPWTGTALAYALAERTVVMPHILMDVTDDMWVLLNGLAAAENDSLVVCDAIDRLGVDYVLDFGTLGVHGGTNTYTGLEDLAGSSAVEKVDSEGDAVLYRVVLCD